MNNSSDDITREFTLESFSRSIDSCNDKNELKDLCKRGFKLYLNERDFSRQLYSQVEKIKGTGEFVGFMFGINLGVGIVTVLYLIFEVNS